MIYYTLHEHNNEEMGRYLDCVAKLVQIGPVLTNKGIEIRFQNAHKIMTGERWHNRLIIIKHDRQDSEALTPDLLTTLKMIGEKKAKALLRSRKRK